MPTLTDAYIRRLPPPERGNRITYDDDVKGFGVRITASDHRAFILNYRTRSGRERRYTIGEVTDWRTTAARKEASDLKKKIDTGIDPLAVIQAEREAPIMGDLIDKFEQEHVAKKLRASTAADYKRMIRTHVRPHFDKHMKVADVKFSDIDALHRKLTDAGTGYRANRVIALCSKMFALAVRPWEMRSDNPVKGIAKNKEMKRKKYIKPDELERLTQALRDDPSQQAANIIRILLMTGARRGEVLAMRWEHIDLTEGKWSKPASSTKQNEDHIVPLSAPVRQLLSEINQEQGGPSSGYVFPSTDSATGHFAAIKEAWIRITKRAGITGLRIHDLRHSFASQAISGGAPLAVVGALLGHSDPSTTARYAHLFDDVQRAATERVGAVIAAAGQPAAPEPIPFRKKRRT
jgi:integrase